METPLKDLTEMDEEKFLYCFGESTEQEKEYLIKTGQLVERDGEYFNVSTLSESGFKNDLEESILSKTEIIEPSLIDADLEVVEIPVKEQSIVASPAQKREENGEILLNDNNADLELEVVENQENEKSIVVASPEQKKEENGELQSNTEVIVPSSSSIDADLEVVENQEKENSFVVASPAQKKEENGEILLNENNAEMNITTSSFYATPMTSVKNTPAATPARGKMIRENTFIGLYDVNMFQSPMGTASPRVTRNSTILRPLLEKEDLIKAGQLVGEGDGECFHISTVSEHEFTNDLDKSIQSKTEIIGPTSSIVSTPSAHGKMIRDNTFIGLEDVNLFQSPIVGKATPRVTRNESINLMSLDSKDCSKNKTYSLSEHEITKDLDESIQTEIIEPSSSIVSTPIVSGKMIRENTFIGLDDVNMFQSPMVGKAAPGLTRNGNESVNLMILDSKDCTKNKTFSLSESGFANDLEIIEPPPSSIVSTPSVHGKMIRENTFIGLDDVNMFQSPIVGKISPGLTRNESINLMILDSKDCSKNNTYSLSEHEITKDLDESILSKTEVIQPTSARGKIIRENTFIGLHDVNLFQSPMVGKASPRLTRNESINLMILDSSNDCSKNITSSKEDLDNTFETVTKLLAMADEQEAKEAIQNNNVQVVRDTPASKLTPQQRRVSMLATPSPSPSPLKSKRLMQLKGKNSLFSPSPPRPLPNSASTPIFKTPTSRPKTPKLMGSSSPSRKLYADIPAKVDSGLRKSSPSSPSGFSLGLDSPVAEYIHSKVAPSPFQRVIGIPKQIMSTGKPMNAKPMKATMIPRPSLPFLSGSSKFNSQPSSSAAPSTGLLSTEVKFKQIQYNGSKATVLNNASFAEKHQKENYVAERHTGVRAENVDVSMVQGGVIEKKFLGQKLPKFQSQLRLPHNFHL